MKIDQKALELTKKFAKGAPCAINFSPKEIKFTVFWPHYEKIAEKMKLPEVNEDVVKEYWFEIHNRLVFKQFQAMKKMQKNNVDPKEYENCMVSAEKRKGKTVCIHGGVVVCAITENEFNLLKDRFQEDQKGLQ
jgi:hypothetical protein